jgi:electron transfer flavoprotein alpha subunit
VFVYAEHTGGRVAPVVYELICQAGVLAQALSEKVGVVIAGDDSGDAPERLIAGGADEVYVVRDSRLALAADTMALSSAVADVVARYRPQIMLFGATPHGRELAPRVAYATSSGLTADCTRLAIGDLDGREGILLQTRPALGGNIMATIISKSCRTQMATVRPGVFAPIAPDTRRQGTIIEHKCLVKQGGVKLLSVEPAPAGTDLAAAQVIVAGGAGMRSQADFERYLQPLASALGAAFSLRAAVGASRRAVEHSYATRQMQVGQTGQTVSPVLYVAAGISGAVQHISAIQKSKVIVAINPDATAPIFRSSDIGIVGRAEVVIPGLLDALRSKCHGK